MKLLKFYAEWCGPCKVQSKIIKDAGDKIKIKVEDVDIDLNVSMSVDFNVRSVPTMILVDDRTEVEIKRHVGVLKEAELLEWLNK
jgi:thioredoxin 1